MAIIPLRPSSPTFSRKTASRKKLAVLSSFTPIASPFCEPKTTKLGFPWRLNTAGGLLTTERMSGTREPLGSSHSPASATEEDEDKPKEDDDRVFFMASHLNPHTVLWSSDPEWMRPTIRPFWVQPEMTSSMFTVDGRNRAASEIDPRILNRNLRQAAEIILGMDAILVIAGAGMGCDSGLPDYRGPEGFYSAYPLLARPGLPKFEHLSESPLFRTRPELAWGLYAHRIDLYRKATPHDGFQVLKRLETELGLPMMIMTSNIDSHFQIAGFPEEQILETHGSLNYLQCVENCEKGGNWPLDPKHVFEVDPDTLKLPEHQIPHCRGCGGFARPAVSFFSDGYRDFCRERYSTQKERLLEWLSAEEFEGCQLGILEIGCGVSLHSLRFEAEELVRLTDPWRHEYGEEEDDEGGDGEMEDEEEGKQGSENVEGEEEEEEDPENGSQEPSLDDFGGLSFASVSLIRINPGESSIPLPFDQVLSTAPDGEGRTMGRESKRLKAGNGPGSEQDTGDEEKRPETPNWRQTIHPELAMAIQGRSTRHTGIALGALEALRRIEQNISKLLTPKPVEINRVRTRKRRKPQK